MIFWLLFLGVSLIALSLLGAILDRVPDSYFEDER